MDNLIDYNNQFNEFINPPEEEKKPDPEILEPSNNEKIIRMKKKPLRQIFDMPKKKK